MNQLTRNDLRDVLLVGSWARGGRRLTANLADVLAARLGSADALISVVRVPHAQVNGFGQPQALRHAHLVVLEDGIEVWPSTPAVGDRPVATVRYGEIEALDYHGNMLSIDCKAQRQVDIDCGRDTAPWLADVLHEQLGRCQLNARLVAQGGEPIDLAQELELDTVHLGGYGTGLLPATKATVLVTAEGISFRGDAGDWVVTHGELTDVVIAGPGEITEGGGWVGGGFGIEGALEGAAMATVLNALTTTTRYETLLRLVGTHFEAVFLTTDWDTMELELDLAGLRGFLHRKQTQPAPRHHAAANAVPTGAARFCPACGTPRREAAAFCVGCGGRIGD